MDGSGAVMLGIVAKCEREEDAGGKKK